MRVVIINYGMGNIKSISSTLKYLGVNNIILSSDYDILKSADKLILPGVGSFSQAINQIKKLNLDTFLDEIVIKNKKSILGICLGMQLLTESSTEDGHSYGLSYVKGNVTKFKNKKIKVPHIGFNQVSINKSSILFDGINDNSDFYFVHSYKMLSKYDINQSICNYGNNFISSFEYNNIFGVQFHPELSQSNGLRLLSNFLSKS